MPAIQKGIHQTFAVWEGKQEQNIPLQYGAESSVCVDTEGVRKISG